MILTAPNIFETMALNLSKHGSEMQRAWKQVCDANESTDWALYGYEGKKNTLISFTISWKFFGFGMCVPKNILYISSHVKQETPST